MTTASCDICKLPGDVTINLNASEYGLARLLKIGRAVTADPAAERALFGMSVAVLKRTGLKGEERLDQALAVLSDFSGVADPVEAFYKRQHKAMGAVAREAQQ